VLTVDQRNSRRAYDRVEELLSWLAKRDEGYVRPFERTAGDEVQGILDEPADVASLVLALVRQDIWSVGPGVGEVNHPLPPSTRAGSGPAFTLAREAVTVRSRARAGWRWQGSPPRRLGAHRPCSIAGWVHRNRPRRS